MTERLSYIKARDLEPGMVMQDPRAKHIWARLASVRVGNFIVALRSSQFAFSGHSLSVNPDDTCLIRLEESDV